MQAQALGYPWGGVLAAAVASVAPPLTTPPCAVSSAFCSVPLLWSRFKLASYANEAMSFFFFLREV
jgi:hypothetical protein